jgi:uncharacterized protein YjbI with pentapeptide repeats
MADLTFIQDRDGMPDFLVSAYLNSQKANDVVAHILARHEIENYLLEPSLIAYAAALGEQIVSEAQASDAILNAAELLKARARRASLETAKAINRHLLQTDRWKEDELEVKVYEWFDGLNLKSIQTVQAVFPGKEMLQETLKIVNNSVSKQITRGLLVAGIQPQFIAKDICDLLASAGGNVDGSDSSQARLPLT